MPDLTKTDLTDGEKQVAELEEHIDRYRRMLEDLEQRHRAWGRPSPVVSLAALLLGRMAYSAVALLFVAVLFVEANSTNRANVAVATAEAAEVRAEAAVAIAEARAEAAVASLDKMMRERAELSGNGDGGGA